MAVTAVAYGTQNAVIGTEHTLYGGGAGVPGVYTFHVEVSNLDAGETVELRIWQMILTANTPQTAYFAAFTGISDTNNLVQISAPIANELTDVNALMFTLKQISGSPRNFDWKVLQY